MMYDEFLDKVDEIQTQIKEFNRVGDKKSADIKKLDLLYLKVNYYDEAVAAGSQCGRKPNKSFLDNLDCALNEIGNWRDYLYETYHYEEA